MKKVNENQKNYIPLIVALILFIAISWICTIVFVPKIYGPPDGAGTFGDMFGSLNTLFSGLAFVGVIIAILLQKSELELQRKELTDTREVLKDQKLQLVEQNKTLNKQNFEGTFFQLLRLYNDVVNSIDIDINPRISIRNRNENQQRLPLVTGRDVFVNLYSNFSGSFFANLINELKNSKTIIIEDFICSRYESFYEHNQSDLGHYFKTIYSLIKFVDNSEIENKKFYTDILRAQLSSHEILIINYNCRSIYGKEKLFPYIDKYNLLKHLPKKELIETQYADFQENERKKQEKAEKNNTTN